MEDGAAEHLTTVDSTFKDRKYARPHGNTFMGSWTDDWQDATKDGTHLRNCGTGVPRYVAGLPTTETQVWNRTNLQYLQSKVLGTRDRRTYLRTTEGWQEVQTAVDQPRIRYRYPRSRRTKGAVQG